MFHLVPNGNQPHFSLRSRWLLGGWSLFLLSGFALAFWLPPDPRGYGTHQGLGLPPCTFQVLYNLPCPSCGMTTSFSHFVRGELAGAVRANVAGFLLALVCAVQIPWCWISLHRGRPWLISRPGAVLVALLTVLCAVALLQWGMRILFR